jgi:hypothetical protein
MGGSTVESGRGAAAAARGGRQEASAQPSAALGAGKLFSKGSSPQGRHQEEGQRCLKPEFSLLFVDGLKSRFRRQSALACRPREKATPARGPLTLHMTTQNYQQHPLFAGAAPPARLGPPPLLPVVVMPTLMPCACTAPATPAKSLVGGLGSRAGPALGPQSSRKPLALMCVVWAPPIEPSGQPIVKGGISGTRYQQRMTYGGGQGEEAVTPCGRHSHRS